MTEQAVSFSLSAGDLTVRDEAGGGSVLVSVDADASITPATDAWFDVPVDDAVSLETSSIRLRKLVSVFLRDDDGTERGKVTTEPFEIDSYGTFVDVDAALKLLIYVERGKMRGRVVEHEHRPADTLVTFEEPTRVVVGARSTHERPVTSMTVTDDPADLLEAVSLLGASIKEWSAERSWPTLRGHPPLIQLGEERRIPDDLSVPDTGVTVGVPPEPAPIFRIAPLATYLGADLVPNDRAELRLGSRHVEPLGSGKDLEASVDRLLARCLLLDTLVRIGGYYTMPRREYDELAPELPFYPPELYDEPIDQQLLEYLEVPFGTLRPYVPEWPVAATVRPVAGDVETLPYVANALGRVRVTDDGRPREPADADTTAVLSTSPDVDRGVASVTPAAWTRAVEWGRPSTEEASLLFVGDTAVDRGRFTAETWERFRDDAAPTATYRKSLTTAELRTALDAGHLYVHYGGGVAEEGLVCSDGVLPFEELPEGATGVLAVRRPTAGIEPAAPLLETAAVTVLTDAPCTTEDAQRFGMLLSLGLPVGTSAALTGLIDRARFHGDVSRSLVTRPSGSLPTVIRARPGGDGTYSMSADLLLDDADGLGQITQLVPDRVDERFQLAGTTYEFEEPLSRAEIERELVYDSIYLLDDGSGRSASVSTDDLLPE